MISDFGCQTPKNFTKSYFAKKHDFDLPNHDFGGLPNAPLLFEFDIF
jgi:hypothetical protein